jgi:ribosome recycling factor
MSGFEVKMLRHELAAAETEIREVRRKVIEQILELFKDPDMAKKDIERVIRGML